MAVYDAYEDWKSWKEDAFLQTTENDAAYFDGELSGIDLEGAHVLELGFGNGNFLGWAQRRGATVAGTELLTVSLARAKAAGIPVLDADLSGSSAHNEEFDLIVAFDVFEHLSVAELRKCLDAAALMLKVGGHLVARFPNSQSPLGVIYQHGDHTHRSFLSAAIIRQLIVDKPLKFVRGGRPFRTATGSFTHRFAARTKHKLQDIAEGAIHAMYGVTAPMSLNAVVVLRKDG